MSWQSSDRDSTRAWEEDQWSWNSWGQGWDSWSWGATTSWQWDGDWSSSGAHGYYSADEKGPLADESAKVQQILKRGHTVDQLSTADLQLVVKHIDNLQQQQQQQQAEQKQQRAEQKQQRAEQKPAADAASTKLGKEEAGAEADKEDGELKESEKPKAKSSADARSVMFEALKETKEADPERSLTEVRKWPECEDFVQYLCLVDSTEEDCDEEEFEQILEAQAMSPEEAEIQKAQQERKTKANKALTRATEKIKVSTKIEQEGSVEGMSAQKVQEARGQLQGAVDRDEVDDPMDNLISTLSSMCETFDKIHKDFQRSDDEDGDTASGLLQNILERVSNGESGRNFKGKIMSGLMKFKPGNDARDFFRKV
ncbi:unnamed protein product, partial [Symbiodinium necroappetens]